MSIVEVIGWKFNHQKGMRCKEIDGVMQIVEFPGGVPSQADQDLWTQEYNDWIASTVKLYESMDSKQAAKIITNYSDNVARDIIYAMKKKKAAEILSNLNSEQIVKLTRADDGL